MSLLSVVREVCMPVGVNPPTSMFGASIQPRTQAELLDLANEIVRRISYDVREWRHLKSIQVFTGDGVADRFALPADYKRMLLTSQVYPSISPKTPLKFVSDANEWLMRRINNWQDGWGEWTLMGDDMLIYPILQAGQKVTFAYLNKNCIAFAGGGYGDKFASDNDVFRIDERVMKLGMIWQWKANKGSPYAEDMGTYSDALVAVAGNDTPAPIIVDSGWDRGWTRIANANIIQQ